MRFHRAVLTLIAAGGIALAAVRASADVILDPKIVSRMLAEIGKLHEDSTKAATREERLDALYDMGERVLDLTDLMTKDLGEHGANDPALASLIVTRLKSYGIVIQQDGPEWKYDLAAFHQYLRLAPNGERVADARYVLVGFAAPGDDPLKIQKVIADKERFIHDYPKYSEMSMVKFLLAQDHVHLGRVWEKKKDKAGSQRQQQLARNLYLEIVKLYPDSEEAKAAAENLTIYQQMK